MNHAISMDYLMKTYNGKNAVDHISFSIEQGELFDLLGVDGAGKTTLIKLF